MPARAGHHARLFYKWEDDSNGDPNFAGTPNDSDNKPFGSDATLSTFEGSNNAVRQFNPNSRDAREVIERQFDGSWSVEFTLTNPWWLRSVIDNNVSTSGTSAPYTHTFSGDVPYSMQITQQVEDPSTDTERVLKGCVVASAEISVSGPGEGTVTLEGAYADESFTSGVTLTSQPTINEDPLHFGEATLDRAGSTISLVQSVSVSIENNTDLIYELGSRTAVDYSPKVRSVSVTYGDIVEDSDEVQRMYGSSGATSPQSDVSNEEKLELIFDNGKTGSSKNLINVTLKNAFPDSYSRSGVGDPEADLEGTLSEIPTTPEVTAENSQSTAR